MRGIDYTGYKHGRITVLYPIDRRSPRGERYWHCKCTCGKELDIRSSHLKTQQSCGCLAREQSAQWAKQLGYKNRRDLTNQRFGRLIALYPIEGERANGCLIWHCKCDCGNECNISSGHLLEGDTQSCGCLKSELTSSRNKKDITGQKFGKLTALYPLGKQNSIGSIMWFCKCDCGNTCEVSSSNLICSITKSCGCLKSFGESEIIKYLNENKIKFKKEITFKDLISSNGGHPRFDFGIYDSQDKLLCLIEYQGLQHFIDSGTFGQFQREETDQLKKDYCERNNIKLYFITYEDQIIPKIQEICNKL